MSKKQNAVKNEDVRLLTGALNVIGLGISEPTSHLIASVYHLVLEKGGKISLEELEKIKADYQQEIASQMQTNPGDEQSTK